MPRKITAKTEWDALPAGTTITATMTGSDGRADVSITRGPDDDILAHGSWSTLWGRLLDIAVVEPKHAPELIEAAEQVVRACIQEHEEKLKEIAATPMRQYRLMTETEQNPAGPDKTVIAELLALGWTPPARKES